MVCVRVNFPSVWFNIRIIRKTYEIRVDCLRNVFFTRIFIIAVNCGNETNGQRCHFIIIVLHIFLPVITREYLDKNNIDNNILCFIALGMFSTSSIQSQGAKIYPTKITDNHTETTQHELFPILPEVGKEYVTADCRQFGNKYYTSAPPKHIGKCIQNVVAGKGDMVMQYSVFEKDGVINHHYSSFDGSTCYREISFPTS
jgi:hypothetical protein